MTLTEQYPCWHSNEKPGDASEEGFDPPVPLPTIPYNWNASQRITSSMDCVPPYSLPASLHDPKKNHVVAHFFKYSPMLDQANNPVARFRPIPMRTVSRPAKLQRLSTSSEVPHDTELRARRGHKSKTNCGNNTSDMQLCQATEAGIEGKTPPIVDGVKNSIIKGSRKDIGKNFQGDYIDDTGVVDNEHNEQRSSTKEREHRYEDIELDPSPDAAGWMKVEAADSSTSSESSIVSEQIEN